MALTKGTGPFGERRSGTFNFDTSVLKAHTLYFENCPKRVRAVFNGETVVDSRRVKILHETGHLPIYYFPEEDLRQDLLKPSDHTTHCPFKGDASYRSVKVGDRVAQNAVWSYPEPLEDAPPISGYVAFYHGAMDKWLEEDEEIFVHPRDPYHRVDIREELLVPSGTKTQCPYKGVASYWSVDAGGERVEDLVWSYQEPIPEAGKIKGHLCFFNERVDLEVDGEEQKRPQTQW